MTDDLLKSFIQVTLKEPEDFLKIKETLTRIGIAGRASEFDNRKTLHQSCNILHKKNRYYITHFKELFKLDGRSSDFSEEDKARRNTIANLLADWGLLTLVDPKKSASPVVSMRNIMVIPYKQKHEWNLVPKYIIGNRGNRNGG